MRQSQLLLPTERRPPADAEALSHKLMVRAGLIRQVGAGLWTWLPAGWRVHQRAAQIVREEMVRIGCQELLMPVLTPGELWKRSGRWDKVGGELFRLQDRKGADMNLAMTHEETVTFHVSSLVRSYRDLPLQLFHLQIKERDEPRPRAGVLRTREFIMKDAYSFDRDADGLDASYERYREAYHRVYQRAGLRYYEVASDVGMMGGTGAHEYMAPCAAGEDDIVLAGDYAANLEIATADAQPVPPLPDRVTGDLDTPGASTIEALASHLGVPAGNLLKAFPVVAEGRGLVLVLLRGDHQVRDLKLTNALKTTWRPATEDELVERGLVPGYMGPVSGVDTVYDAAVTPGRYVVGANRAGWHTVVGVDPGERLDVREVAPGDTVDGVVVTIEPAIEVGNIFKLGTRYSEPLGATYLDEGGKEQLIVMGSYGIGPARICAAAIEQHADDRGISWPRALAPFDVHVVALGKKGGGDELDAAVKLHDELTAAGLDVLLDDRDAGTGAKLTDAELLGVPLRLAIGRRGLEAGAAEAQRRRGQEDVEGGVPLDGAIARVQELLAELP